MSAGVDAVNAYLERLPAGIDSYPECQTKGAAIRSYLDTLPAMALPDALPARLSLLLERPPLASGWISEVQWHALMIFFGSEVFGERGYLDSVYDSNLALLSSMTYRVLFRLVSTRAVLAQAASRWSLFHRGTTLETVGRIARKQGVLRLTTPAHHCPPLIGQGYAEAFRAAAVASGPSDAEVEITEHSPTVLEFAVRWT